MTTICQHYSQAAPWHCTLGYSSWDGCDGTGPTTCESFKPVTQNAKPGMGEARALLRADLLGCLARLGYATPGKQEIDDTSTAHWIPPELGLDGLLAMIEAAYEHFTGDPSVSRQDIENWLAERVAKEAK